METSILFCIKDPIPFIIIGGTSGIGKTSILDFILDRYPDFFEQPISYTSREKRDEKDRYVFVSKDEMLRLNNEKHFINFDEVHGDYYGIKKDEIIRIKKANKIPIKEIHPNNFYKFSDKEHSSISVIIESKHDGQDTPLSIKREGRPKEDFSPFDCDFKINTSNLSVEESASLLLKKLWAYKVHSTNLPHPNLIDRANKIGYQKIAEEFDDDKRITTKNFHDASIEFWGHCFDKIKTPSKILEVGYGNGWLFNNFPKGNNTVYGIDISENMISNILDKTINSSSRHIPVKSKYFDYIFGSLIDPLISLETFVEIERLLSPNGFFAFTVPAKQWAINLTTRTNKHETTFIKQDGEKVNVFSFCNVVEILPTILCFLDFEIEFVKSYCLPNNYNKSVSTAITCIEKDSNIDYKDLPVVTAIILKKKNAKDFQ